MNRYIIKLVIIMKKFTKIILIIILLIFIGASAYYIKLQGTNEYKLKRVGYSKEEIKKIDTSLERNQIEELIETEYNEQVSLIISEKYFIKDKLDDYINYQKENEDKEITDVISIVNAGADKEFYTDIKEVDISKDTLMLINKFNILDEEFAFDDIKPISLRYAYDNQSLREEALDKYIEMWQAANKEGLLFVVQSSYRDYDHQKNLYDRYSNREGKNVADTYSARPGHSEHQTGLAVDLASFNSNLNNFEETEEYEWVKDNAHLYGFILRYPKGKEHITGYMFEPWHYRYVGVKVAKEIYEMDITFDEYYELFLK